MRLSNQDIKFFFKKNDKGESRQIFYTKMWNFSIVKDTLTEFNIKSQISKNFAYGSQ